MSFATPLPANNRVRLDTTTGTPASRHGVFAPALTRAAVPEAGAPPLILTAFTRLRRLARSLAIPSSPVYVALRMEIRRDSRCRTIWHDPLERCAAGGRRSVAPSGRSP